MSRKRSVGHAAKIKETSHSPDIHIQKMDSELVSDLDMVNLQQNISDAMSDGFSQEMTNRRLPENNMSTSSQKQATIGQTEPSDHLKVNNEVANNFRCASRHSFIKRNKESLSPISKKIAAAVRETRSHSPTMIETDEQKAVNMQIMKKNERKNKFNPEIYKFKKYDYNVQQEKFKEQFYQYQSANKTKIAQQLAEVTYIQILHRLDKEKKKSKEFPIEFRQNEMKWAAQMMRSKKLQKIMAEYTEHVAMVLEAELNGNIELVQDWVKYPHSHSTSPARNTMMLSQLVSPVWYPERPPVGQKVQTIYNRQRQHLQKLSAKNQQKKEEEIDRKVRESEDIRTKIKITDQVLARMAAGRKKRNQNKSKEPSKPMMTPFQEAIHEGLQNAKTKIDDFQMLDEAFQEEIEAMEQEKIKQNKRKINRNPGLAIKNLLTKWADEPTYSTVENAQFSKELWMCLEEFENFLKEQNFGMELENKSLKMAFKTRVDGIRAQTSFRIEALESALIETKLKLQRERERSDMRLAEMESTMFNQQFNSQSDELDRLKTVDELLNNEQFNDIDDASQVKMLKKCLKRLQNSIKAQVQEKIQFTKEIKELQFIIERDKQFNEKTKVSAAEDKEMVLYYQQIVYEILENTGILNSTSQEDSPLDEDKKLALKEIFELNQERLAKDRELEHRSSKLDQTKKIQRLEKFVKEFHDVAITVDFRTLFNFYQQVVNKKEETIGIITDQFAQLGLIDQSTLELRKINSNSAEVVLEKTEEQTNLQPPELEKSKSKQPVSPSIKRQQAKQSPVRRKVSRLKVNTQKTSSLALETHESMTTTPEATTPGSASQFQHGFRVSDQKLKVIKQQFNFLALPVGAGMGKMMKEKQQQEQKDKMAQAAVESAGVKTQELTFDVGQLGALGLDSKAHEIRHKRAIASKKGGNQAFVDKLKKRQAGRVVEQEKKEKKAQQLAEKKAEKEMQDQLKANVPSKSNLKASRANLKASRANLKPSDKKLIANVAVKASSKSAVRQTNVNKQKEPLLQLNQTVSNHGSEERSISMSTSKDLSMNQSSSKVIKNSSKQIHFKEERAGKSVSARQSIKSTSPSQKKLVNKIPSSEFQQDLNQDELGDSPKQAGFDSDKMMTEPIDRTKEVLEELETKILNKYHEELDQVNQADQQIFKLKAAQNKQLSRTFQASLGTKLQDSEDTALMMIGNLPEFIEKLNETQQKYTHDIKDKISVAPLSENHDNKDYSQSVPLTDCIMTEIDTDGELRGFKIRPEIIKVLMWREEGQDLKQIYQVIRTVNFLNRLMFKPDYYMLAAAKPGEQVDFLVTEQDNVTERNLQETPLLDIDVLEELSKASYHITDYTKELFQILRSHSAALCAKGDTAKYNYQMRISEKLTLDELLTYKLPKVVGQLKSKSNSNAQSENETVVEDERKKDQLTFLQYIEILLQNLEEKIYETVPQNSADPIKITDLVFDGIKDEAAQQKIAKLNLDISTQTTESSIKKERSTSQKKKYVVESKYSMQALSAKNDKKVNTDEQLLIEYLKSNSRLTAHIATQHIDKAVGEEMSKTISTLNDFVSKVHQSQQMTEISMQNKKELNNMSMFGSQSKSIATQMSSNSPLSQGGRMISSYTAATQCGEYKSPVEQLKAIRTKIENNNEMVDESIQHKFTIQLQREKIKALRTAEMKARKSPQRQNETSVQLNNSLNLMANSKLPKVINNQDILSCRNTSYTVTGSGRKQQLINNETQNVTNFYQQPFKQVHVDKQTINESRNLSHFDKKQIQRPSSGVNPPGLVTKKLMAMQHSDQNVNEKGAQIKTSLDQDLFRKKQFDTVTNPTSAVLSPINSINGGINVYGNKGGKKSKNNFIYTTNVDSSVQMTQLFSPSDRSIVNVSKTIQNTHLPLALQNLAHLRISGSKDTMREARLHLTKESSQRKSHQIKPSTSREFRDSLQSYDLPKRRVQQYLINVEPLSSQTRKTSTCMTVKKNSDEFYQNTLAPVSDLQTNDISHIQNKY